MPLAQYAMSVHAYMAKRILSTLYERVGQSHTARTASLLRKV